jgi:hypothetical protein
VFRALIELADEWRREAAVRTYESHELARTARIGDLQGDHGETSEKDEPQEQAAPGAEPESRGKGWAQVEP